MISWRFYSAFTVTWAFILLGSSAFTSTVNAQSFRQQYEDRIDAQNQAREARLRYFIEPFTNASVCFRVEPYEYDGGARPIICKMNNGSWLIAYGKAPNGNHWDGRFSGSIYGQNGYSFSQMQKSGREDVAARLTIIDGNTFRVQFGSNACKYSPVLECQLSDKKCFSQQGPAGSIETISKNRIIELFKE